VKKIGRIVREGKWWFRYKVNKHPVRTGVFVLGTGRSGTHFLTKCLISHPELTDLMDGHENPFVFKDVVDIALNNCWDTEKIDRLIEKYKYLMQVAAPKGLVDQSHPNLWFADAIARNIEQARFIWIVRDPFSVTYSTLQHSGVRDRFGKWQAYPVPNPFLGIDRENEGQYATMSIPEQSALRWISHARRLGELKPILKDRLLVVRYEDLCLHGNEVMKRIADFLNMEDLFSMPPVTTESLHKKKSLSEKDIEDVCRAVDNFTRRYELEPETHGLVQNYLNSAGLAEGAS
jgi:hypothetical protein